MDRPFTSELVFVMIWAVVEFCALRVAQARSLLGGGRTVAAFATALFALVTGLVCHGVYYLLDGRARFYAGLIPATPSLHRVPSGSVPRLHRYHVCQVRSTVVIGIHRLPPIRA